MTGRTSSRGSARSRFEASGATRRDQGPALPRRPLFDFLLFDRDTALVHDYGLGAVGKQTGGWLVRDQRAIEILEETALSARSRAVPLAEYVGS